MSTSEQDVSDSNLESPFSQSDSPYSSPSHQVPQLANIISDLSCAENTNVPKGKQKETFYNLFVFHICYLRYLLLLILLDLGSLFALKYG